MKLIPRVERGIIKHKSISYGTTNLGITLEIYLPEKHEPKMLLMAGIHGDEPDTTVLLSEALRSTPIDELHNAVILCANPDGMSRGTRANARGVDLNRNFSTDNWTSNPVYHRNHVGEPQDIALSTGHKPESEPETRGLLRIIDQINPREIIAFHSALDCVEDPNNSKLGQWLSKNSGLKLIDDVGYPTPGSFGTWAKEKKLPLITFEFPDEPLTHMKTRFVNILNKLLQNEHLSEISD